MTMSESPSPCAAAAPVGQPRRRTFLRLLTGLCGTIAALVFSVPVVGYFIGLRKRRVAWVALGPVSDFPLHETRRINFDNPLRQPWDGHANGDV